MERDPEVDRVRDLWDSTARERVSNPLQGWLDSAIVLESYVQPRLSGSTRVNWLPGVVDRLRIPKDGRWLSLGCGSAELEIFAAGQGLFRSLTAYDASPVSLDQARQAAAAQGFANIEFRSGDIGRIDLPNATYDVVLMNMSLHHVKELRSLLSKIRRVLATNGFLLVNEFIGPRQFQFTDLQLSLVTELLAALPARWRQDSSTGGIKTRYERRSVEHWNAADPSEAIRSDRIVVEIEKQFQIVERTDYGGTILNLLLEHIVHNFEAGDEKDVAAIRLLATCEAILIRHGVIPSDFTTIAARKPGRALGGIRSLFGARSGGPSGR